MVDATSVAATHPFPLLSRAMLGSRANGKVAPAFIAKFAVARTR